MQDGALTWSWPLTVGLSVELSESPRDTAVGFFQIEDRGTKREGGIEAAVSFMTSLEVLYHHLHRAMVIRLSYSRRRRQEMTQGCEY